MKSENHYMFIIKYPEKNIFQVLDCMLLVYIINKANKAFKLT